MKSRILIVEDDLALAQVLRDNLEFEGYAVDCAVDGRQALAKVREQPPDLVLLDLMLPQMDGLEVCRQLATSERRTPIIIITARQRQEEKIKGLELGADDYVTKPYALEELLARICAVLRRARPNSIAHMNLGDVELNFGTHRALRGKQSLGLSNREFELLHYLAERPGKVVTREELLRAVWGYHEETLTRTIDNFVVRLRRKIEVDPRHPRYILTARGGGYLLVP
jgi:DNA-binding response OmpR family regulator